MKSAKRAVVDGLMMGNAVSQQVKLSHGIVYISPHAVSNNSRKRLAKAGQPE
jgi:hypothetical protein